MNIDLIKKLKVGRENSTVLIAELEHCDKTIRNIDKIRTELSREYGEHNKKINELSKKLSDEQLQCSHPLTTYHGDPSGGSDSSTFCDICGKEIFG